jgi:hypothetical protein
MLKKGLNIFISILLLLPLFAGEVGFFQAVSNASPSFQKPCDMDDCNPNMPKCPLCPSFSSINLYLYYEAAVYLPTPTSSFIQLSVNTLSDQGFVKAIFHPPTITS